MIVDVAQFERIAEAVREISVAEGARTENLELGAMFEVPSACVQASRIYDVADFGSIGSNDLTQYLFAVDRDNEQVSGDYDPDHPVLWTVLEDVVKAAGAAGKPLSICGEMAGRDGTPTRLLDIGIRALSVSPRLVPRVRNEMALYRKGES
jgi:phosphoenolpyruvate-protein kinase (PTS system EI component)